MPFKILARQSHKGIDTWVAETRVVGNLASEDKPTPAEAIADLCEKIESAMIQLEAILSRTKL